MKKIPILIIMVCCFTMGCTTVEHRQAQMDANWGRAYETVRFGQILNPDAENNLDPITGFEGTAAQNALNKYQKGFVKEESTSKVFDIKVSE